MYRDKRELERIESILGTLSRERFHGRREAQKLGANIKYRLAEYGEQFDYEQQRSGEVANWSDFGLNEMWGGKDIHIFFCFTVEIPKCFEGQEVRLMLETGATDIWNTDNPQFIYYRNGQRVSGMDMNHNIMILSENAKAGEKIDVAFAAYANNGGDKNFLRVDIAALDKSVNAVYYDIRTAFETARELAEGSHDRNLIVRHLIKAVDMLNLWQVWEEKTDPDSMIDDEDDFHLSAVSASQYLHQNLYGQPTAPGAVYSIGHTHIDVAWKWEVRQTKEKTIRSFSTVMDLMKRYPNYKFMASTPQLYQFVKENEPELYEEIKERVKEGRFEPEGAMWLEADSNLVSAESMIRQIMHGQKFFIENFGKKTGVLWLPDVFGYSAAMPQILKKCGINTFMTTKIGWNDTNRCPNDLFTWKGIDGSSILAYFITTCDLKKAKAAQAVNGTLEYTYNGRQNPTQILATLEAFQNRNITENVLTCYGYGDGGGGPTEEMLEMSTRMEEGLPGLPKVIQSSVTDYFNMLHAQVDQNPNLPEWDGELYLEYHRGTYTSMAENKRNNRRAEYALTDAESFDVLADRMAGKSHGTDAFDDLWKLVLLDQFHDIIPGSAIEEVYQTTDQDYEHIFGETDQIIDADIHEIVDTNKSNLGDQRLVLFNMSGSSGSELHYIEGNSEVDEYLEKAQANGKAVQKIGSRWIMKAAVPAKGYAVCDLEEKTKGPKLSIGKDGQDIVVDSEYYAVRIDENGEIVSLFDKRQKAQLVKQGGSPLGRLLVFQDRPHDYDNWNIDATYEHVGKAIDTAISCRIEDEGELEVSVYVKRKIFNSEIEQHIRFYRDDPRIDFDTDIDWQDHQILLKAEFDTDLITDHVTCEIQSGHVNRPVSRNTSWEQAKFECCAHKWIDMSEEGCGMAILNDGRFGYDAKGGCMRLTLLKSGIYPNPHADMGKHHLVYSLLPHVGNFVAGRVIEEAYELNTRTYAALTNVEKSVFSMVGGCSEGVYVDVIKKSEDGQDVIIRLYEGYGARKQVELDLSFFEASSVQEVSPDEYEVVSDCNDQASGAYYESGKLTFGIKPFEIRTFRLIAVRNNQ